MTRTSVGIVVLALVGCSADHPIEERYPHCLTGQRCPLAGQHCAETALMGMRCLPPCALPSDCMASEVCLYIGDGFTPHACFPPGAVRPGEPCVRADDCVAGCACIGTAPGPTLPYDEPPRCQTRCDRQPDGGATGACGPTEFCTHLDYVGAAAVCIELCDPESGAGCPIGSLCLSGTRCEAADELVDCHGFSCPLGEVCDAGARDCVTPVQYAERHPPS